MADTKARLHIVCYDIADPRRLVRVHRCLVKRGIPLQYSVFLVRTNKAGLVSLMEEISPLINVKEDDVRAYPLPHTIEYIHRGRQLFPEGISLISGEVPQSLFTSVD